MDNSSQHNGVEGQSREKAAENQPKDAQDTPDSSGKRRFDLKKWMKKNPQALRIGGGVAVLHVLLVLLWFFVLGGSDKKTTRRPPPSRPSKDALAQLDMDDDDEQDDEASPDSEGSETDGDEPDAEEPEPEIPPLPEDVAEWEPEHFERARREGDQKLLEAVGHLGRTTVHDEAAVTMLTALLQPPEPEEPAEDEEPAAPKGTRKPPRHRTGRATDPDRLAEAVVEALAVNDTAAARELLKQIISGKLATEGDESKVIAASLKALAGQPTSGNEEMLFELLTASDQFRDPSRAAAPVAPTRGAKAAPGQLLSAEGLRAHVLGLLEKTASVGFRVKLAAFLMQPTTPLTWRAEMGRFLLEPDVDNLGAQFVMYRNERLEDEIRTRIEQHFARRSTQAMQAMLDIARETPGSRVGPGRGAPAARGKAGVPGRAIPTVAQEDPELPFRLARQLWGDRSTEVFTQRLADLDRREDPGHLLALCATMPVETVRSALLAALTARHGLGPDAIEKAGVPKGLVADPGFLLVVKSLDRQEPQAPTAGRPGVRAQPQAAAGRTADDAGLKWMKFSEELVSWWCERLDDAARVQAEKARLAGKNPDELRRLDELPVELHEGAEVRSAYHLVLPGTMADKLSGARVGPMRIQYVRTEDRTSIRRIVGYYRRVLRMRDGRPIDNGLWFDTYRTTDAPGMQCSLDVLIRLADKKVTRDIDLDADENLVIEVLSIEAREP